MRAEVYSSRRCHEPSYDDATVRAQARTERRACRSFGDDGVAGTERCFQAAKCDKSWFAVKLVNVGSWAMRRCTGCVNLGRAFKAPSGSHNV